MKRRKRVSPKEDATYYVQKGCDKGGLDVRYINAYKGLKIISFQDWLKSKYTVEPDITPF